MFAKWPRSDHRRFSIDFKTNTSYNSAQAQAQNQSDGIYYIENSL